MNVFDRFLRDPEKYTVYFDEVILKDQTQETVTFRLSPDLELNPFGKYQPKRMQQARHRFLMLAVLLNDGNEPVDVYSRDRLMEELNGSIKTSFRSESTNAKLVQRAGILCKEPPFQGFVKEKLVRMNQEAKAAFILQTNVPRWLTDLTLKAAFGEPGAAEEWCKYYLYFACGIKSRAKLATNKAAQDKFCAVYEEFNHWRG